MQPKPETARTVLTVDEVAAMLGISRSSAYLACANGSIPCVIKVGRLIRIPRKAFERWLEQAGTLDS